MRSAPKKNPNCEGHDSAGTTPDAHADLHEDHLLVAIDSVVAECPRNTVGSDDASILNPATILRPIYKHGRTHRKSVFFVGHTLDTQPKHGHVRVLRDRSPSSLRTNWTWVWKRSMHLLTRPSCWSMERNVTSAKQRVKKLFPTRRTSWKNSQRRLCAINDAVVSRLRRSLQVITGVTPSQKSREITWT